MRTSRSIRIDRIQERGLAALLGLIASFVCGVPSAFADPVDAIAPVVLESNVDVKLAELDYKIARSEIRAGLTDFDPFVTVRSEYRDERLLSNSTLESANYHETTGSVSIGLKKKFTFGTQAEIAFQELWLTSDSLQTSFGDRDQIAAQLKFTQPLLKGRGSSANEATFQKAKLKADRYRLELRSAVNDALQKTIGLYFDLVQAKREAKLKAEEVSYFAVRKDEAADRLKAGLLSSADELAIRARHQVALAESYLSEAKATEAEEKLGREFTSRQTKEIPLPVGVSEIDLMRPPPEKPVDPGAPHPSIAGAAIQGRETAVDLAKAKSALMPQLDFSIQGSTVGAGSNHSIAEEGLVSGRTPSWQVMLSFSMPFENHSAIGEVARLSVESSTRDQALTRQTLEIEKQKSATRRDEIRYREALSKVLARLSYSDEISAGKQAEFSAGRLDASEFIRSRNDYVEVRLEAVKTAVALWKAVYRNRALENRIFPERSFERYVRSLD